jgi:pilus assembly protein CpaE
MLVQHPSLVTDVQTAVVVSDLTLASARDTIRILSWLKSNAPNTVVQVAANKVPAASAQLEISRKDFESSIERKIDFAMPLDAKLAAQAAKLGKPFAEAGKNSKTVAPLLDLASTLAGVAEQTAEAGGKKKGKGGSLMGRFDLKALMPKREKK